MSVSAEQERFHFLDGLRGIAAFMVVVHHAFTPNIMQFLDKHHIPYVGFFFSFFTQSGVNLFFVLSGVVLLRPYLRQQRSFKAGDYFRRRVKRIYPPYFFALLFTVFVIWFNSTFPTWYNIKGLNVQMTWQEVLKEVFIFNFDGYYYNLSWWSLQIEMLFYVLVPLVILVFPKSDRINNRKLAYIIGGTLIGSIVLQFFFAAYLPHYYSNSLNWVAFSFFKFADYPLCFVFGALIAARDFNLKQAWLFIAMGLVLLVCALFYLPAGHSAFGLIYAGVIVLAFNIRSFKRMLSTPFMIWLGERSYSLFLVHYSAFYLVYNIVSHFTPERNLTYGLLTRTLSVPSALFVAMLLFHFVERRQARGLLTANMFWPWQVRSFKSPQ
jgi:peptidoglycan/LPS O-acetylase OafA/YrhL